MGWYSDEYRLIDATDVHEVMAWANERLEDGDRYVLYVEQSKAGASDSCNLPAATHRRAGRRDPLPRTRPKGSLAWPYLGRTAAKSGPGGRSRFTRLTRESLTSASETSPCRTG